MVAKTTRTRCPRSELLRATRWRPNPRYSSAKAADREGSDPHAIRKGPTLCVGPFLMAEREGFEPSREIAPPYRFSKPTPSASWVPLLENVTNLRFFSSHRAYGIHFPGLLYSISCVNMGNFSIFSYCYRKKYFLLGGESGIRTHEAINLPVFKTGTFNRSVISP
jgi:hypothetical protein